MNDKPKIAYSEMKFKLLINQIEKRQDKNKKNFWIIRTRMGAVVKDYLAFSTDYSLKPKTLSLLINYSDLLKGRTVLLTVKKTQKREKVIEMEIEKD